jgi:hypothetical protein
MALGQEVTALALSAFQHQPSPDVHNAAAAAAADGCHSH